jgi:hypothetical protein
MVVVVVVVFAINIIITRFFCFLAIVIMSVSRLDIAPPQGHHVHPAHARLLLLLALVVADVIATTTTIAIIIIISI